MNRGLKMSRKRKNKFNQSLKANIITEEFYYQWIKELAINRFKWLNLPDGIDYRFVEKKLFENGKVVFFYDDERGTYFCLPCMANGKLNVYDEPVLRTAYSNGIYNKQLNITNSVIIYDNYLRNVPSPYVEMFSYRLYEIDRTMDVNVKGLKNPVIIKGDENSILTMKNLYMQYDGNEPVIYANSKLYDRDNMEVINLNTPNNLIDLDTRKQRLWNEIYTWLGINNANQDKKERLVADEVEANNEQVSMGALIGLNARRQACEKINEMFFNKFGMETKINVVFNSDIVTDNYNLTHNWFNFLDRMKGGFNE